MWESLDGLKVSRDYTTSVERNFRLLLVNHIQAFPLHANDASILILIQDVPACPGEREKNLLVKLQLIKNSHKYSAC